MEKSDVAASQADGTLLGVEPMRAARPDRPHPGDRRHDRAADPHRAHPARHRGLRRDGCPGPVGDGLPAGRDRLRVHELQPVLGRSQRPPDVRDAGRRDDPVRCRPVGAAADDDGAASAIRSASGPRRRTRSAWPRSPATWASSRVSVGLRKGYFSGEAGLQVPGYREQVEATWGMVARDQYGTGELGLHSGECERLDGVHFGGTGFAVAELIDPDTGDVLPFTDGQQGEVVYTSIRREASPLLRMRSHDLMQVFTEPCALRSDELPVPHPRSVRRHVHRQGRERVPAGHPGVADDACPTGHGRVPGRPRSTAADRLPGAARGRESPRRARTTAARRWRAKWSSGSSAT